MADTGRGHLERIIPLHLNGRIGMSVPPRRTVGVPRSEQAGCLLALVAELTAQGWIAYEEATPPHQPAVVCVQDRQNRTVLERVMAGPDDASGTWYYWRQTGEPIAPVAKPRAAADAITGMLARHGAHL
jgi:hypothetical protein